MHCAKIVFNVWKRSIRESDKSWQGQLINQNCSWRPRSALHLHRELNLSYAKPFSFGTTNKRDFLLFSLHCHLTLLAKKEEKSEEISHVQKRKSHILSMITRTWKLCQIFLRITWNTLGDFESWRFGDRGSARKKSRAKKWSWWSKERHLRQKRIGGVCWKVQNYNGKWTGRRNVEHNFKEFS